MTEEILEVRVNERTACNPNLIMTATLSATDYFDALDRLPDPTYTKVYSQ